MIGRTNAKRGGSGNVTEVQVLPATQGVTVTASRTGKSKTATTNASGVATFKNLDMGYDWTFTWSTFSKTEKIDQLNESVMLGAVTIPCYVMMSGTRSANVDIGTPLNNYELDEVLLDGYVSGGAGGYNDLNRYYLGTVSLGVGNTYRIIWHTSSDALGAFLYKDGSLVSGESRGTGVVPITAGFNDRHTIFYFDFTAEEVSNYIFTVDED